jgi:squalene-hopene/tetraprenyl-beta-curcumene cyclase
LLSFFPQHIRQEIAAATADLHHLQARWAGVALSNEDETTIYDGYPYLFLEAFPSLNPSDVRTLALAGRLFAGSLFAYDGMLDRSASGRLMMSNALGTQAMQLEAYHLLYRLFAPDTAFWTRFRRYMAEYATACLYEQQFASGERPWQEYSQAVALEIAVGKTGVAKAAVAGLAELAGDDALLETLIGSIAHYYVARQMWDDLCDWKEDLQAGVPSLLLSRVLQERPGKENEEATLNRLACEIYYGGHAPHVLRLALESLDQADDLVAAMPDLLWRCVIGDLRRRCQALLRDMDRIVHGNLQRVRQQPKFTLALPPAQSRWQQLAWQALRFIVQQWRLGFGEARHIMCLTQQEGFSAAQEYHYGDVFQQALIADALCDAERLLNGHLQPIIRHQVDYLISQRLTSGVGGWRYFPTVPELAPDADDLGQVMQVLLRAGYNDEVAKYCEGPLTVLLHDNARPDGSFETWIVPATARTPEQERQAGFNRSKWGAGPDNEVMANLLYALAMYDKAPFADAVQGGVAYLEEQQSPDGSWPSRWYYGPYYGTYVCLRLLTAVHPNSSAIGRALGFLRATQHADGGWGLKGESDPLNTALALLSLASVGEGHRDSGDPDRSERALSYLHNQRADNGWPAVPFIRPRMNEPYSSRTMTHVYILKAAVVWHELVTLA